MTIATPAIVHIRQLAEVYLERFGQEDIDERGQFVLVKGEHGSGKTHALSYVKARVEDARAQGRLAGHEVLQLYVKVDSRDLVSAYRKLMLGVDEATLRDLAKRFLAAVVAESAGASRDDDAVRREVNDRVRHDPDLVLDLFQRYFVDPGEALELRDVEVAGVTEDAQDFRRALSYLHVAELAEPAAAWLSGVDPGEAALRKLGISGPIASPEMARRGLQLLARLCRRAGTALLVYIDQYEKLVVGGSDEAEANAGHLSGLVEAVPNEDAMIVLAGNEEAWEALPPDLPQRFAYNIVECEGFALDEATSLLYVYIRPIDDEPAIAARDDDALWPLTNAAIRAMHVQTRGNPRRLLQLASRAFRAAAPEQRLIDDALVTSVLRSAGDAPVDPARVLADVRRLAEGEGFAVGDPAVYGDTAVSLELGGVERLLLIIGQATHYYDEVLDLTERLDTIEDLRRRAPGARAVLLVLGYDSPAIRNALAGAGIETLAYRPETFADDFRPVLEQTRRAAVEAPVDGTPLSEELAALREALEHLRAERDEDARGAGSGVARVAAEAAERDARVRWENALQEWVTESRRLTDRIADIRRARREQDLKDLERLRERAEADRRFRLRLVSALVLLVVVVNVYASTFTSRLAFDLEQVGAWSAIILLGLGLAWFGVTILLQGPWGLRDLVRPRALRELTASVTSTGELQRLAVGFARYEPPVKFLVRSPNPQVRYAAAIVAEHRELGYLGRALPSERSAIVRRAFAKRLGRDADEGLPALEYAVRYETPEAAYIYEGLLVGRGYAPHDWSDPALDRLEAIVGRRFRAPGVCAVSLDVPIDDLLTGLDDAFAIGLPYRHREVLRALPLEVVRRSLRATSPFDEGGLGTYDDLDAIEDVDRAYLQLSQVVFLSELGLLVDAEP